MRVLRNASRVQDGRGARASGQLQELLQGVLLHRFHKELVILQGKTTRSLTRQERAVRSRRPGSTGSPEHTAQTGSQRGDSHREDDWAKQGQPCTAPLPTVTQRPPARVPFFTSRCAPNGH